MPPSSSSSFSTSSFLKKTFTFYLFLAFGSHPATIRGYSRLCTRGLPGVEPGTAPCQAGPLPAGPVHRPLFLPCPGFACSWGARWAGGPLLWGRACFGHTGQCQGSNPGPWASRQAPCHRASPLPAPFLAHSPSTDRPLDARRRHPTLGVSVPLCPPPPAGRASLCQETVGSSEESSAGLLPRLPQRRSITR